ncbi:MAG: UDP-N-acetylmuramoyl-tripeptide--D-alanyl-D-alanine ligase [Lachnospiraceae bacterium]|nr:UDP-N-acetylmuramoyl-tripeptide--D-alanyl-D-alanine ligase [Lachnospiraceae bacterium]
MMRMEWKDVTFTGVCYDNREVKAGDLFFAFPGETHDGHDYVVDALSRGAVRAVVSHAVEGADPARLILVKDTIKAYGALAEAYRAQFHIPAVGITGSVGKTTTKDMITAVLSEKFKTVATKGNLNNHIGLPRTVFGIDEETEVAVLEMGMNHLGEISYLTRIAQPTIATITNVGDAHIGLLGSRENIFKAKREIFEGLSADGLIVLNVDDEYLRRVQEDKSVTEGRTLVTIGEDASAMLRAVDVTESAEGISFVIEGDCPSTSSAVRAAKNDDTRVTTDAKRVIDVPLPGHHIIYPTLTAYAIGRHLGMTHEEIARGIRNVVTSGKRMEIITREHNVTILNDTYNANPQSMKAALHTLAKREGVKKIAVLGDMFELGDDAVRLHEEVGTCAAQCGIDVLVAVGELSAHMAEAAHRETPVSELTVIHCRDKDAAAAALKDLVKSDCAVLFKASRGMALETLIDF